MEASSQKELTPMQRMSLGTFYERLARMLPTEGRDYELRFSFAGDRPGSMSVSMRPINRLGEMWCKYCMDEMSKGASDAGQGRKEDAVDGAGEKR